MDERLCDEMLALFMSYWWEEAVLQMACPMGQSVEERDTMDKIGLSALTK